MLEKNCVSSVNVIKFTQKGGSCDGKKAIACDY